MKKYIVIGSIFLLVLLSRETKAAPVSKTVVSPLQGDITSKFGMRIHPVTKVYTMHNGIDIKGQIGDPVICPFDGIVKSISYDDVNGNLLKIFHVDGWETIYAHLSKIFVILGEHVAQGEQIAAVGATGRVTGPHLHFGVKDPSGNFVDPLNFII